MNQQLLVYFEIAFDLFYLVTIWSICFLMYRSRSGVPQRRRPEAFLYLAGFLLLALGDTGHVGFRVLEYLGSSAETVLSSDSGSSMFVGIGSAATAFTITILYLLLSEAQRIRDCRSRGILSYLFYTLALLRIIIMVLPGNQWNSLNPPYLFSLLRNAPLTVTGLILASVYLRSGYGRKDPFSLRMGYGIILSFAFYLPVILFVRWVPLIGMLMIPKTLAYLYLAVVVRRQFFSKG